MNQVSLQLDDLLLPYTFDQSVFEHIKDPDLLNHIDRVGTSFYKKAIYIMLFNRLIADR